MIPLLKIKLKENKPPDLARDAWRKACKTAFAAIAWHWFKTMLPRHFTVQARHKYNHRPRSKKWNDRKQALAKRGVAAMGGMIDNVFTGRMMEAVTRQAAVRAFPTRARVSMFGPNYMKINFRSGSSQPNKKKEMVAVTKEELRELLTMFKRVMLDETNKARTSSRTTKIN